MAKKQRQLQTKSPLLEPFKIFIGEWKVEISAMSFRANQFDTVIGLISFKWLENQPFIIEHSEFSDSEFPSGTQVIGLDDINKNYCVLYSDSRGVLRIYEMSLNEGLWKIWRTAPDFSQRFTGAFSDNNNTITARWENSQDGLNWEHDFDLTYTKVK